MSIPNGTPLVYDLDASLVPVPRAGAAGVLCGAYLGAAAAAAGMGPAAGAKDATNAGAKWERPKLGGAATLPPPPPLPTPGKAAKATRAKGKPKVAAKPRSGKGTKF